MRKIKDVKIEELNKRIESVEQVIKDLAEKVSLYNDYDRYKKIRDELNKLADTYNNLHHDVRDSFFGKIIVDRCNELRKMLRDRDTNVRGFGDRVVITGGKFGYFKDNDLEVLNFLKNRFVNHYGENENVDYIYKFKDIIDRVKALVS